MTHCAIALPKYFGSPKRGTCCKNVDHDTGPRKPRQLQISLTYPRNSGGTNTFWCSGAHQINVKVNSTVNLYFNQLNLYLGLFITRLYSRLCPSPVIEGRLLVAMASWAHHCPSPPNPILSPLNSSYIMPPTTSSRHYKVIHIDVSGPNRIFQAYRYSKT
jgi:hypothetical protein